MQQVHVYAPVWGYTFIRGPSATDRAFPHKVTLPRDLGVF